MGQPEKNQLAQQDNISKSRTGLNTPGTKVCGSGSTLLDRAGQEKVNLMELSIGGFSGRQIAGFIDNHEIFYLRQFFRLEHGGVVWNWQAFLFAPLWFAYRKMPFYAAAALGLNWFFIIAAYFMAGFFSGNRAALVDYISLFGLLSGVIPAFFYGVAATPLYKRHVLQKLRRASQADNRGPKRAMLWAGTSFAVLFIFWLGSFWFEQIAVQPFYRNILCYFIQQYVS